MLKRKIQEKLDCNIQTAKANDIKSELYLKYVIENIDKVDINNLLPWNLKIKENYYDN